MDARRTRIVGAVLIGLGLACVLWGVLHLTSATVGGRVQDFSQRRTYNSVKRAAHEAYPGALGRAALGALLVWCGARLRK